MKMNLLNTRQLAEMLGFSVERARGIGRRGDLPSVRIGGRYYFDLDGAINHVLNPKQKSYSNMSQYEHNLRSRHRIAEELASLKKENEVLREKAEQLENKLGNIKNHFWDIVQ